MQLLSCSLRIINFWYSAEVFLFLEALGPGLFLQRSAVCELLAEGPLRAAFKCAQAAAVAGCLPELAGSWVLPLDLCRTRERGAVHDQLPGVTLFRGVSGHEPFIPWA